MPPLQGLRVRQETGARHHRNVDAWGWDPPLARACKVNKASFDLLLRVMEDEDDLGLRHVPSRIQTMLGSQAKGFAGQVQDPGIEFARCARCSQGTTRHMENLTWT